MLIPRSGSHRKARLAGFEVLQCVQAGLQNLEARRIFGFSSADAEEDPKILGRVLRSTPWITQDSAHLSPTPCSLFPEPCFYHFGSCVASQPPPSDLTSPTLATNCRVCSPTAVC